MTDTTMMTTRGSTMTPTMTTTMTTTVGLKIVEVSGLREPFVLGL